METSKINKKETKLMNIIRIVAVLLALGLIMVSINYYKQQESAPIKVTCSDGSIERYNNKSNLNKQRYVCGIDLEKKEDYYPKIPSNMEIKIE